MCISLFTQILKSLRVRKVTTGEASAPGGREFVGEGVGGEGKREEQERRRRMVEDGLRSFVLSGQWVRESAGIYVCVCVCVCVCI